MKSKRASKVDAELKAIPKSRPLDPNRETIRAMKAARRGNLVTVGSVDALIAELNEDD